MGFIQRLREFYQAEVDKQKERRDFLKLVEEETKPIRRSAYLKEKMKQAVIEGRMIASQELEKKKPRTAESFGLNMNVDKSDEWKMSDPMKFINKKEDK